MAIINGSGDGTRLVNWLMGIASAIVIAGVIALVGVTWSNQTTLAEIQAGVAGLKGAQQQQERKDDKQDEWIAWLVRRIEGGQRERDRDERTP